jgi:hypothetical protein
MEKKELKNLKIRIKFGINPFSQRFICSYCRKEFEKLKLPDGYIPDSKSLFLKLEVNGEIMDFPICYDCSPKGLFETKTVIIKNNASHQIGLA